MSCHIFIGAWIWIRIIWFRDFITGRLFDILDGKYARYLYATKRWSSEWDGATLGHTVTRHEYTRIDSLSCLHWGDNWKNYISRICILLKGWMDVRLIGEALMSLICSSKIRMLHSRQIILLIRLMVMKIKATVLQTVAVGCILLHESLQRLLALRLCFCDSYCVFYCELEKKAQLQRANALQT